MPLADRDWLQDTVHQVYVLLTQHNYYGTHLKMSVRSREFNIVYTSRVKCTLSTKICPFLGKFLVNSYASKIRKPVLFNFDRNWFESKGSRSSVEVVKFRVDVVVFHTGTREDFFMD